MGWLWVRWLRFKEIVSKGSKGTGVLFWLPLFTQSNCPISPSSCLLISLALSHWTSVLRSNPPRTLHNEENSFTLMLLITPLLRTELGDVRDETMGRKIRKTSILMGLENLQHPAVDRSSSVHHSFIAPVSFIIFTSAPLYVAAALVNDSADHSSVWSTLDHLVADGFNTSW